MLTTHFLAFMQGSGTPPPDPGEPGDVPALRVRVGSGGQGQTLALKDPASRVDWGIDWADLATGETIAISTWNVSPAESGGLAVVDGSPAIDGSQTSCRIEGGLLRRVYRLQNTITTSAGRVLTGAMTFRIGHLETGL